MALRPSTFPALALAFALVAVGGPLAAEEPVAPSPAERMAKVLANLPKPGSGAGLSFEGELLDKGAVIGSLTLSVEAAPAGSAGPWRAVDEMRVGPQGELVHVRSEAFLDAQLMGLEGRTVAEMGGEPTLTLTWKRDGEGYLFTQQEGEGEAKPMRLASPSARVPTMAALVFLALQLPREGGAYAVEVLLVDANLGEDPGVRARLQTLTPLGLGPVEVGGVPKQLLRVALTRAGEPDDDATLALAADGKGLVQVDQAGGGTLLRLRQPPPPEGPFDFHAPAKTAQGAALKAARAFAVADIPALEALIHWPSVDAKLAARPELKGLDKETRRKRLMAELAVSLEARPPEMIEAVLRGTVEILKVEDLGQGRARVTFPPLFQSLKLVVRQVGEVWWLDELPE